MHTDVRKPTRDAIDMSLSGRIMLVIDDDAEVSRALVRLLTDWGCTAYAAMDGQSACLLVLELGHMPDLIISDYRLPHDESGLDVLRRLAAGGNVKAVVLTGDIAPEVLKRVEDSGYPLLHKPVAPKLLRQVLDTLLQECRPGAP